MLGLKKKSTLADVEVSFLKCTKGHLHGKAIFSADFFSLEAATRMAGHFCNLAEAAIADASRDVWELPLLSSAEELQLDAFHGASSEFADAKTVVDLLNNCFQAAPDAVAVEYEPTGEQLSYGELQYRVQGLAAHLVTLGLVPDALVGLMLERSCEMMVAIYAIWMASCCYVPFDITSPRSYLCLLADDLRKHNSELDMEKQVPPVLLSQSWVLKENGSSEAGTALVDLFTHALPLDEFKPCSGNIMPQPKGCNLAYCIYTSGSTGRPKGTLLEHKGLLNYTHASLQRMQGITRDDVILQKTPYVFDVSLWEFTIPLTCAAKLLMAKHEGHKDPSYVIDAIRRGNVTVTRDRKSVV